MRRWWKNANAWRCNCTYDDDSRFWEAFVVVTSSENHRDVVLHKINGAKPEWHRSVHCFVNWVLQQLRQVSCPISESESIFHLCKWMWTEKCDCNWWRNFVHYGQRQVWTWDWWWFETWIWLKDSEYRRTYHFFKLKLLGEGEECLVRFWFQSVTCIINHR